MKIKNIIETQKRYDELEQDCETVNKLYRDLDLIYPKKMGIGRFNIITTLFDDMRTLIVKTERELKGQLDEMEV